MAGRDITESRATRAIAVDIGIQTNAIWQNTGYDYDCAIGGLPFLMAMTNGRAYERGTTPFRGKRCVRTSYNNKIRVRYAGIGMSYNESLDAFIRPKCHPEAILNETTCNWDCSNAAHDIAL